MQAGRADLGKYDPLRDYLRKQSVSEMFLSFREIEKIIGAGLPDGALRAQWWANAKAAPTAQVQHLAWGAAGYEAFLHAGRKVRFRKAS